MPRSVRSGSSPITGSVGACGPEGPGIEPVHGWTVGSCDPAIEAGSRAVTGSDARPGLATEGPPAISASPAPPGPGSTSGSPVTGGPPCPAAPPAPDAPPPVPPAPATSPPPRRRRAGTDAGPAAPTVRLGPQHRPHPQRRPHPQHRSTAQAGGTRSTAQAGGAGEPGGPAILDEVFPGRWGGARAEAASCRAPGGGRPSRPPCSARPGRVRRPGPGPGSAARAAHGVEAACRRGP